ncbi:MAG: LTA synthase family protein, partial [Chitinophagaceae bacterium]
MNISKKSASYFNQRFGPILLAVLLLCSISLLTRIALLINVGRSFDWSVLNFFRVFLVGFCYDLAATSYAIIPLVIYLWLVPSKWFGNRFNKSFLALYFFIIVLTLLFNSISEWIFWDEFSVRYNFIAVDYLIYTTEVIGNIRQSYPVIPILLVLVALASAATYFLRNLIWASQKQLIHFGKRTKFAFLFLLAPVFTFYCVDHRWKTLGDNQYANELSGNGMYDFGFAFWHNQLDYDTFYVTMPIDQAVAILRKTLAFAPANVKDRNTLREIKVAESEKKMNVIMISVESLSADFLGSYGNTKGITPNLDTLAKQG